MSRHIAPFALALLASAAAAEDRAVVVGIDLYPGLGLAAPLSGARADAERFAAFLIESAGFTPSQVTVLTDAAATSDRITMAVLDDLVGKTTSGDRAVFYFAGLGSLQSGSAAAGANAETEVLLAHDAPSILAAMPNDALTDLFDIIADRQVTLVVDTSFRADAPGLPGTHATGRSLRHENGAGAGTGTRRGAPPFGTGRVERAVWGAAAVGQYAWEAGGTGVFTAAFIEGIATGAADANDNGTISNAELLGFVRARSADWCSASADCTAEGTLTPDFSGPVQARPLVASAPEMQAPAAPKPQVLPVATLPDTTPGLAETLGFVTDLFTPSNKANLRLGLSGEDRLKLGDAVRIEAIADRPGMLVLLDVNPAGELVQVFPSTLAPSGSTRMSAGETLTIPNGSSAAGKPIVLRVTEPAGQGFLLGLFIEDDLPRLTAVLPENLAGGPIPNAGRYLYEIAQDLLRLQSLPDGMSAVDWSATYLPYEILP